jgi:hypothetical protein
MKYELLIMKWDGHRFQNFRSAPEASKDELIASPCGFAALRDSAADCCWMSREGAKAQRKNSAC